MKKLRLTIQGQDYLVSFPNVGQMMEIEQLKLAYTNGKYVELAMSNLKNHVFLLDYVDSISYLSVLIPELKSDLKVTNWMELEPQVSKELIQVYRTSFLQWYKPILDDLYDYNQSEAKTPANDESKPEV